MGTGLDYFISDPKKVQTAVGGIIALTAGYYATKGSLGILMRFIEARLG